MTARTQHHSKAPWQKRASSPHRARWLAAPSLVGLACVGFIGCPQPNIPDLDRPTTTAALRSFEDCGQLERQMKENLSEEMRTRLLQAQEQEIYWLRTGMYIGGGVLEGDGLQASPAADDAGATNGARQEGTDYSGTNNQEEGVDEADFVKTDGYHIYVINGRRVEILGVPEFGQLEKLGTAELEGYPTSMLLDGDEMAVFSQVYTWDLPQNDPLRAVVGVEDDDWGWYWRGQSLTKLTLLDISDRTDPQVRREIYLEGWLNTGREVEGTVRMISYGMMDLPGLYYWPQTDEDYWNLPPQDPRKEQMIRDATAETIAANEATIAQYTADNFIPRMYERRGNSVTTLDFTQAEQCANFSMADDASSHGVTSILTVDLQNEDLTVTADHIVTNWSTIYASTDVLIVAEASWDWWWFWGTTDLDERTNLHRFDISVAGETQYTGSGRVEGNVLGQFALDEHEGTVRVATTTGQWGRWWLPFDQQEPSLNHLFLLRGDDELKVTGSVRDLAPEERIWASRFTDTTAYLVTFRNIDPLWAIDVTNPSAPEVLGELEVPGVSTYLHPIDNEEKLLTIGFAGDDEGLTWGQTQISLFDVSDKRNPTLKDSLGLSPVSSSDPSGEGWVWSWSEATYNHHAFQYWGPQRLLAVPLSTYRYSHDYSRYEFVSKLQLVDVQASGLTSYGAIDHSSFFDQRAGEEDAWWWGNRDVRRTIFMGDYIYAISDRGVTVHLTDGLVPITQVDLPGAIDEGYGYY